MNYIAVCAVGIFSGGHNNEEFISCIDDLNVVKRESAVECNGYYCFHRAFVEDFSDFYVCNFHFLFSP